MNIDSAQLVSASLVTSTAGARVPLMNQSTSMRSVSPLTSLCHESFVRLSGSFRFPATHHDTARLAEVAVFPGAVSSCRPMRAG